MISPALATTTPSDVAGWMVASRIDAPTDGRLLIDATYEATVVANGPDGARPLEVVTIKEPDFGAGYVAALPPPGGWAPGGAYVAVITNDAYGSATTYEVAFSVAADVASTPSDPIVVSVAADEWLEDQVYLPGNCCAPLRTITISVTNADPDPWSWVELRGDTWPPGAEARGLDIGLGPGEHALEFRQWVEDDGIVRPSCFEVVGVAADGDESPAVAICPDPGEVPEVVVDGPAPGGGSTSTDPTASGCSVLPAAAGPSALLLVFLAVRRHERRSVCVRPT